MRLEYELFLIRTIELIYFWPKVKNKISLPSRPQPCFCIWTILGFAEKSGAQANSGTKEWWTGDSGFTGFLKKVFQQKSFGVTSCLRRLSHTSLGVTRIPARKSRGWIFRVSWVFVYFEDESS